MLYGLLGGLLNQFNLGISTLGEIVFLTFGVFSLSQILRRKIGISKCLIQYSLLMLIFIVYTISFYYLNIICYDDILKNVGKYIGMYFITVFAYFMVKENEERFYKFLLGFSLGNFFAESILDYSFHFLDYNILHYAGYLLPLLLLFQIKKVEQHYRILLLIGFLISIYARSRTAILIIGAVFIYILLNNMHDIKERKKIVGLYCLYLFLFLSLMFFTDYFITELAKTTASNLERYKLLDVAIEIIKNNFITGVGPSNFARYSTYKLGVYIPPNMAVHNFFLDIFANWGLIGVTLILIPFISSIKEVINHKGSIDLSHILIIYFIIVLMFNVVSGDFRMEYSFLMAIVLLVGEHYNKKCLVTRKKSENIAIKSQVNTTMHQRR